jgi:NADPH2:quinone reductase
MKEVIVHPLPELHTTIHDNPIPHPKDDELLIKVAVVGSNVKGTFCLNTSSGHKLTCNQTGST